MPAKAGSTLEGTTVGWTPQAEATNARSYQQNSPALRASQYQR